MSSETAIEKVKTLNEIIESARELPLECQDFLLSIAKGMLFAKNCIAREHMHEGEQVPINIGKGVKM